MIANWTGKLGAWIFRALRAQKYGAIQLTNFRPMFHLRTNHVVGFTTKMFEQHLWKSDILSKDAGHWQASLLKMSLFHRCCSNILLVKTNYLVST